MHASTGPELFAIVERYDSMGFHRTGTKVDAETASWLSRELTERGLTVESRAVSFERWVYESRLVADGTEIDHLPVYYEWTGSIATDRLYVTGFDAGHGGFPGALAPPAAAARDAGTDAAVLATTHPKGSLVAVNRIIGEGSGFPIVLVAGRELDRLERSPARLELTARVEPGATTNIVATNDHSGPPILLTTPLTGWFTCAGERATGLAVLLNLVERFANRPLLVVATGGHELGYFGARHWVESNRVTPAAIAHIGASVAVDAPLEGGVRALVDTRLAMTDMEGRRGAEMAEALAPIGLALITGADRWIGESEVFCDIGAPMLSLTGNGIDFHTPDDRPERATSPASLHRVAGAVGDAIAALLTGLTP